MKSTYKHPSSVWIGASTTPQSKTKYSRYFMHTLAPNCFRKSNVLADLNGSYFENFLRHSNPISVSILKTQSICNRMKSSLTNSKQLNWN
jgi:hypothetical protein